MSADDSRGGYYAWTAFLRCPNCGRTAVDIDHYDDGTFFRCRHCGAEAWAEGVTGAT